MSLYENSLMLLQTTNYIFLQVKFEMSCYFQGLRGAGDCESWYTKFQYWIDIQSIIFCVSDQTNLILNPKNLIKIDLKRSYSLYSQNISYGAHKILFGKVFLTSVELVLTSVRHVLTRDLRITYWFWLLHR